ncbi:inositol monophosphatase family protein [Paracoccus pacificus]|uniref:Inositol monophosphatase family protein n=1 Tax=Paracoccus pacificus TaxID=1463598 RepID=A0ABW4RAK3_9RHOB
MTQNHLTARLARAEQVAGRAARLALDHYHRRDALVIETKRHPTDLVSEADRAVEALIRDALADAFPDDALLGEELGLTPGTSGVTWIIDPIDGTAPYLNGLPGWCVSIGAMDGDGPAIGVIAAPMLNETFTAMRGGPARLNGATITASRLDLQHGMLGVGANDRVPAARVGEMLGALTGAGSSWIRYGSGALMLAWVAAGRLVGYVEPRMSAWDCMAGYCLIGAAGGRLLPFPADEQGLIRPAPVLGANCASYDDLLRLTRLDDDRFWTTTAG